MLTGRSVKVDLVAPAVVNRQVVYEADVPPFPNKISEERMANQRTLKYFDVFTVDLQLHQLPEVEEGEEVHHSHATNIGHLLCTTNDGTIIADVTILLNTAYNAAVDTNVVVRLNTTNDGAVLADVAIRLNSSNDRAVDANIAIRLKAPYDRTVDANIAVGLNLTYDAAAQAEVVGHHIGIDCEQQGKCHYQSQNVCFLHCHYL